MNLKNIAKIAAKVGGVNHGFRFLQVPVFILIMLDQRDDARSIRLTKPTRRITFRNRLKLENQRSIKQPITERHLNKHSNARIKA